MDYTVVIFYKLSDTYFGKVTWPKIESTIPIRMAEKRKNTKLKNFHTFQDK